MLVDERFVTWNLVFADVVEQCCHAEFTRVGVGHIQRLRQHQRQDGDIKRVHVVVGGRVVSTDGMQYNIGFGNRRIYQVVYHCLSGFARALWFGCKVAHQVACHVCIQHECLLAGTDDCIQLLESFGTLLGRARGARSFNHLFLGFDGCAFDGRLGFRLGGLDGHVQRKRLIVTA